MRGLNGSGGVFSAPLQHCYWSVEVGFLDSHHLIAAFSRLQSLEADFNILECPRRALAHDFFLFNGLV